MVLNNMIDVDLGMMEVVNFMRGMNEVDALWQKAIFEASDIDSSGLMEYKELLILYR